MDELDDESLDEEVIAPSSNAKRNYFDDGLRKIGRIFCKHLFTFYFLNLL